jgi:hypothetical protein
MNFDNLINQERLARTFIQLCETDSPSREEGRMAALVTELLCTAGATAPFEDASAEQTGADCGNLIFRFAGDSELEGMYQTFGYPLTPLLFIVGNCWIIFFSVTSRPIAVLFALGTIAAGMAVYLFFAAAHKQDSAPTVE